MKSSLSLFPLFAHVLGVMSIDFFFLRSFLRVTKQVSTEPGRVSKPRRAHHHQQRLDPCPADGASPPLPHLPAVAPEARADPAAASVLPAGGAGLHPGRGRQGRAPSPGLTGPSPRAFSRALVLSIKISPRQIHS